MADRIGTMESPAGGREDERESVVHSELHAGGRTRGERLSEETGRGSSEIGVSDRIRAHPLASLGLAFGAGMLLSRAFSDDEEPRVRYGRRR